jgi:hypothetical protein
MGGRYQGSRGGGNVIFSLSQDSELSRREQLEKKLEENKNKPKKKRKKLM